MTSEGQPLNEQHSNVTFTEPKWPTFTDFWMLSSVRSVAETFLINLSKTKALSKEQVFININSTKRSKQKNKRLLCFPKMLFV